MIITISKLFLNGKLEAISLPKNREIKTRTPVNLKRFRGCSKSKTDY